MKASLQALCEQFIRNRDVIKSAWKMGSSYLYPLCANIFCARGAAADEEKLRACRQMLKEKTSVFSNFLGNAQLPLLCLMASDSDPEGKLDRALGIYALLKAHFWTSEYLTLPAVLLADLPQEGMEEKIARGRALYQRMKKEHPLLTGGEDSVFAVLMGFCEKSDDELMRDMEDCYGLLKGAFSSGNSAQTASHVLALAQGAPEEKAGRTEQLYRAIVSAGGKYSKTYGLATLAAVAVLDADIALLAADILDVDEFLARQKGYGVFGLDRRSRMMHAALIVSCEYARWQPAETAALTSTLMMIAAQSSAAATTVVMAGAHS